MNKNICDTDILLSKKINLLNKDLSPVTIIQIQNNNKCGFINNRGKKCNRGRTMTHLCTQHRNIDSKFVILEKLSTHSDIFGYILKLLTNRMHYTLLSVSHTIKNAILGGYIYPYDKLYKKHFQLFLTSPKFLDAGKLSIGIICVLPDAGYSDIFTWNNAYLHMTQYIKNELNNRCIFNEIILHRLTCYNDSPIASPIDHIQIYTYL